MRHGRNQNPSCAGPGLTSVSWPLRLLPSVGSAGVAQRLPRPGPGRAGWCAALGRGGDASGTAPPGSRVTVRAPRAFQKCKQTLPFCFSATSQTYYIFGQEVTPSKWNMFMTLIGLEGNEIERCRYENRGNLIEVHHEMLITWRSKLGREASIFKLMAALHQMRLRTCLENIINKLIAENILAKHAETPN